MSPTSSVGCWPCRRGCRPRHQLRRRAGRAGTAPATHPGHRRGRGPGRHHAGRRLLGIAVGGLRCLAAAGLCAQREPADAGRLPGHAHNEAAWRERLPVALRFLLPARDEPNKLALAVHPPRLTSVAPDGVVDFPALQQVRYQLDAVAGPPDAAGWAPLAAWQWSSGPWAWGRITGGPPAGARPRGACGASPCRDPPWPPGAGSGDQCSSRFRLAPCSLIDRPIRLSGAIV